MLRIRFETLLLFDPNRSPATANVWISRPSPAEEQALGKIVVISQLAGRDHLNLEVITLIQEELRTKYYQNLDLKPERAFEQALEQLNRRLHQLISDGVGHWVEHANILIAATWRDAVMISSVGTMHAFMLRRSRMHDVIGPPENSTVNPVRLFSQVISGQLQGQDQLLLCTPSLLDYFSLEKLRRTMMDGQPSASVHQWETTLLGIEQRHAFAAIVCQALVQETMVVPDSRPVAQSTLTQSAPQVSMEHLIAKEQATERLLSPSIWPAIRDFFSQITSGLTNTIRRMVFRKPPRRVIPHSPSPVSPALGANGNTLWLSARRVFVGLITSIGRYLRAFAPQRLTVPKIGSPVTIAPQLRPRRRWSMHRLVHWYQALSPRRQVLFISALVLVFVLAIALAPKPATQTANTNTLSVSIADHIAQAKAALLYGGEQTAQEQITAAQQLVNQLPVRTSAQKKSKQEYQNQIATVTQQLAHQTVVTSPAVVGNLAALDQSGQVQQLYISGTNLIALDPAANGLVLKLAAAGGNPTTLSREQDIGLPLTGAVSTNGLITFATDRSGFIAVSTTSGAWTSLDATWPAAQPRIQALAAYQNRIYALDAGHNSIVRFTQGTKSLGAGVPWLKETANLGSARDLAVDGSIYVLQPHGVIEVYANGRKSAFTTPTINPPLTDPTRLWTSADTTALFITDPSNKRIVVIGKNGRLIDQYTSTSWSNLRSIAIDLKTKTAYVLSGTAVTKFTLLH